MIVYLKRLYHFKSWVNYCQANVNDCVENRPCSCANKKDRPVSSQAVFLFNYLIVFLLYQLFNFISEGGQDLVIVADNSEASLLEDIGLGVFVYGNDILGTAASRHMLAGA